MFFINRLLYFFVLFDTCIAEHKLLIKYQSAASAALFFSLLPPERLLVRLRQANGSSKAPTPTDKKALLIGELAACTPERLKHCTKQTGRQGCRPLQSIKITPNNKARTATKPSPAGKGDRLRWMRRNVSLM